MKTDITFCTTGNCKSEDTCLRKTDVSHTASECTYITYSPLGTKGNDRCEYYIAHKPADAQAEKEARR